MALSIPGMAVSFISHPSLSVFERTLYQDDLYPNGQVLDSIQVAIDALADASIPSTYQLGIIHSPEVDVSRLQAALRVEFGELSLIGDLSEGLGSSIHQAEKWIRGNPSRAVLLIQTSQQGTGCVILSRPGQKLPAYALVETLDPATRINKQMGYLEFSRDLNGLNQNIFDDLLTILDPVQEELSQAALGNISWLYPDPGGISSLIHAALAVSRKVIPFCSQELNPSLLNATSALWDIPKESRPWLSRGEGSDRSALLVTAPQESRGRDYLFLQESEIPKNLPSVRPSLKNAEPVLIPVVGKDLTELQRNLTGLENSLAQLETLETLSNNAYTKFVAAEDNLVCSLMGKNIQDLRFEIQGAKTGIPTAFQSGQPWITPKGSYFTSVPLGAEKIAFVYPGAFNSYPGMGRELFDYFPNLHQSSLNIIQNPSHSLAENYLFPRSQQLMNGSGAEQIRIDFYHHPPELIESGIGLSVLYTLVLKEIFNLQPAAAFGYSLGEISMLWANSIWQNADRSSDIWKDSPLFRQELFGEMDAVRRYWEKEALEDDFWASFILKSTPDKVKLECDQDPYVFLTIINTSEEVVIAGRRQACSSVIEKLGCHALPMPFNAAIHNPAMQSCLPAFEELYTNDTNNSTGISFYSAARYRPLSLNSRSVSQDMAKMTCSQVDFPRLVNQVHQDGARIFIEVGPQKTCSRWIEKILETKPHVVIPVNKKYQSDYQGILKVLSLLISHRAPVNLSPLFPEKNYPSALTGKNGSDPTKRIDPAIHLTPQSKKADPQVEKLHDHLSRSNQTGQDGVYLNSLDQLSLDLAASHQVYLSLQQVMIRNLSRVIRMQGAQQPRETTFLRKSSPVYTKDQIIAFTSGDHRVCFGTTFADFGDRRIPRLPNGDLQFIDRIVAIQGEAEQIKIGSSLESEFELPSQSWYRQANQPALPYVSMMELALQPCGFLSAYMGSIKDRSSQDLYFRNLDGEATLIQWPAELGPTLRNRVELLSSSVLKDVIIQNYAFELSCSGEPVYRGRSSFGYFTLPMLLNQSGLDGSLVSRPWYQENSQSGEWITPAGNQAALPSPGEASLPSVEQLWISKQGGIHGQGYLFVNQPVPSNAWFYQAHFYQDPVMPGSLGVEIMAQVLAAGSASWGIPAGLPWRMLPGQNTTWKYRGQITPDIQEIFVELHIKRILPTGQGWQIFADGKLWKGTMPIYQLENLALETY